jgi:4-amino-4-deoxychorismate lyase
MTGASGHSPGEAAGEVVWVNGVREPRGVRQHGVSPLDRGLHFGDGLFETIACLAGRPRFVDLHLERLALGCQRLRMATPDLKEVEKEVRALAADADRAIIKLLVTRGEAIARGYAPVGTERATRIAIRYAWPHGDVAQRQDGVVVRTLAMRMGENPLLAGLKHCNRLEQILARAEWSDASVSEGILFSSSGKLVSGTMSNVFVVRRSRLRTPLVDLCGVAGVMRRVIMREADRAGIEVEECVLTAEDLAAADEVFLTNARIGIWPVRQLDERVTTPGPVTRRLQAIMAPLLESAPDA